MKLHVYESTLGWRWMVEQTDLDEPTPAPFGSSGQHFKTEQDALNNAKHLALGILDALASRAIGES